ncbi:MAG: hypothetical protein ACI9ON_003747, partial [Limisphaerales bacterium]
MHSMTAFARSARDAHNRHIVWELKSVNHRYLETQFRLPEAVRSLEHQLREIARKHLKRGKLDCTLRLEALSTHTEISVNRNVLLQLMAAIEQVKRDAPEIGGVSPMELMRWPGVLDDTPTDDEQLIETTQELFELALTDLLDARASEGSRLRETIESRLDEINRLITEIKPLTTNLASQQKAKL